MLQIQRHNKTLSPNVWVMFNLNSETPAHCPAASHTWSSKGRKIGTFPND